MRRGVALVVAGETVLVCTVYWLFLPSSVVRWICIGTACTGGYSCVCTALWNKRNHSGHGATIPTPPRVLSPLTWTDVRPIGWRGLSCSRGQQQAKVDLVVPFAEGKSCFSFPSGRNITSHYFSASLDLGKIDLGCTPEEEGTGNFRLERRCSQAVPSTLFPSLPNTRASARQKHQPIPTQQQSQFDSIYRIPLTCYRSTRIFSSTSFVYEKKKKLHKQLWLDKFRT
ncbi:hypothetical protein F5I97DRAFT_832068 [Phlebopus sp. FC_14]|nr:hypothetical protein F5I97DRAFT_832068 [Phlebopus sp. FC_14]